MAQEVLQRGDVDKEALSRDLRASLQGTLEAKELDGVVAYITQADGRRTDLQTYAVAGGINATLQVTHINMALISNGGHPRFAGTGGRFGSTGEGAFAGTLYTEDLNALVEHTTNFAACIGSVGVGGAFFCIFRDSAGKPLGRVEAGAISNVGKGACSGKGRWYP